MVHIHKETQKTMEELFPFTVLHGTWGIPGRKKRKKLYYIELQPGVLVLGGLGVREPRRRRDEGHFVHPREIPPVNAGAPGADEVVYLQIPEEGDELDFVSESESEGSEDAHPWDVGGARVGVDPENVLSGPRGRLAQARYNVVPSLGERATQVAMNQQNPYNVVPSLGERATQAAMNQQNQP